MKDNECPNGCGELFTEKFSDLEGVHGCFDVYITHCPVCNYIGEVDAN